MRTIIALALGLIFAGPTGCKPKNEARPADLFTQSYKINTATFVGNLKRMAGKKPGESNQQAALRFFHENNLVLGSQETVLLDEIGSRLLVRSNESERQKIQALFERIEKGQ